MKATHALCCWNYYGFNKQWSQFDIGNWDYNWKVIYESNQQQSTFDNTTIHFSWNILQCVGIKTSIFKTGGWLWASPLTLQREWPSSILLPIEGQVCPSDWPGYCWFPPANPMFLLLCWWLMAIDTNLDISRSWLGGLSIIPISIAAVSSSYPS